MNFRVTVENTVCPQQLASEYRLLMATRASVPFGRLGLRAQCAAVRMYLLLITAPPQMRMWA